MKEVIGHHVAQRAGRLVVAAPQVDAHRLGRGDLDVVDVTAVPDRFENTIAEAEHHEVLHRFFAQIMIDAVNLPLAQDLLDLGVERARRFQVAPKGLLDNDPAPVAVGLLGQPRRAELANGFAKKSRRDRKVVEIVGWHGVFLGSLGGGLLESLVGFRILKIAAHVINPFDEPIPHLREHRTGGELFDVLT